MYRVRSAGRVHPSEQAAGQWRYALVKSCVGCGAISLLAKNGQWPQTATRPDNKVSAKRRTISMTSCHPRMNAMSVLPIAIKPSNPVGHFVNERLCSKCNGPVERVRRRFIDRLVSMITLVHRYRCREHGWGCDWEGNIP